MIQPIGNTVKSVIPPPGPLVTVDFKEPRSQVILNRVRHNVALWADADRTMKRATDAIQTADRLLGGGPGAMGAEFRPTGRKVLRLNAITDEEPLWIIGDVRGDVLALETALCFIDEATEIGRLPQIVFLGDLMGGMLGDVACLSIALERFAAAPTRTILLAGDRELALSASMTGHSNDRNPRNLADMPVQPTQGKALQILTRAFSQLVPKLPVAAICPSGILLAHSAPGRASILADIQSAAALEAQPDALRAFAFDRLHPRDAHVAPTGNSGGEIIGSQDFADSMHALHRIFEMPVERMVRGQDSAPEGHRWFRHYGDGVLLTITTMTDVLASEAGGGRRKPCVARLKAGRLRVVRFEIPEDIAISADQIFPRGAPATPLHIAASQSKPAASSSAISPLLMGSTQTVESNKNNVLIMVESQAAQVHFERGVRLLSARAWPGARQAFQEATAASADINACLLNESVACLCMGLPGHQDALRLCRGLLFKNSANAHAYFNMGVSYLTNERNPIEAGRAFRMVTQLLPAFSDGWWGLGLAFSLRADRRGSQDAFAKAIELKCLLATPSSMDGIIPARELASIFELLRGRSQFHPTLSSEIEPLANA